MHWQRQDMLAGRLCDSKVTNWRREAKREVLLMDRDGIIHHAGHAIGRQVCLQAIPVFVLDHVLSPH